MIAPDEIEQSSQTNFSDDNLRLSMYANDDSKFFEDRLKERKWYQELMKHPKYHQYMMEYCKKLTADGPKYIERDWFHGTKYLDDDPTWKRAQEYLRKHDVFLSNTTLSIFGPKGVNIIGKDRTISDYDLWFWLGMSDSINFEPHLREQEVQYKSIITNPDFYHDSMSFCEELMSVLNKEMEYGFCPGDLGGQEQLIIDDWNRARKYLDDFTNVKSALEPNEY
jgi:hypothetical protein